MERDSGLNSSSTKRVAPVKFDVFRSLHSSLTGISQCMESPLPVALSHSSWLCNLVHQSLSKRPSRFMY